MKSLSILIPIYNEEESLQALFDELKFSFENNQSIEIIFINDGSSDMSQKVIENEIANHSTWKLINLYRNYGKSVALQSGIDIASNELIATLDGDLQDDPKELISLVRELNEDDVIVGWKKDRLDPLEKKIASKIFNFFIKLFSNNELITFKYSGLKNTKIITILITLSLITGIFIITVFYYFSSNLKNFYLELKSPYTNDGKYLAVITKNGLWIRDKINSKTLVINS